VIIGESLFSNMTRLKYLNIAQEQPSAYPYFGNLVMPPNVLSPLDLLSLDIQYFNFSDGAIQALSSLKHRRTNLDFSNCKPSAKILEEVAKFTNLIGLGLNGTCSDELITGATFKNSGSVLRRLSVFDCPVPKLTANMFRGMNKLQTLQWQKSNISEIESGAFNDLAQLFGVYFSDNNIKTLPDGLFDRNVKLITVEFLNNDIENLSWCNFTHCLDFEILTYHRFSLVKSTIPRKG